MAYRGLGAPQELAPDDPILSGEGSGAWSEECSPFDDMFFLCDYQNPGKGYAAPIGPALPPGYRKPGFNLQQWLKENSTAVYAGAGILVLMAMFRGRR